MAALSRGTPAPEIKLSSLDGNQFSLSEARKKGPVMASFFKVSCPVCQYTLPFVERMYKAYGKSSKLTVAAISQDSAADTQAFNRRFGVSFPTLLDDLKKYPASNAYGLTTVPSIFLIAPDGRIELSSVGWSKEDMELLNQKLAQASGSAVVPLFSPGEQVADFKAG